jgi:hypothetical protein
VQIFGASNRMTSSTVRKRIIAVCQMTATNNKEDNVRTCSELIKSAKEKNCMVLQLLFSMCVLSAAFDIQVMWKR